VDIPSVGQADLIVAPPSSFYLVTAGTCGNHAVITETRITSSTPAETSYAARGFKFLDFLS
jgi:hypothetical protein